MTRIIAHAGCEGTAGGSRENLAAALARGADLVELDLRTWGGEVYLSHDPLDPERLERYLTLEQALDLLGGRELNCDLKEPEAFAPALARLRRAGEEHLAVFTGEYRLRLPEPGARYRRFQNTEHLGIVAPHETVTPQAAQALIDCWRRSGDPTLAAYNAEASTLPPQALESFRRAGVPVCCWTVDRPGDIAACLAAGVDYLTTNRVGRAVRCRERLRGGKERE